MSNLRTNSSSLSNYCYIDSNLKGNAHELVEIIDSVCGCEIITYDNYCVADSSGIISYVIGECCDWINGFKNEGEILNLVHNNK